MIYAQRPKSDEGQGQTTTTKRATHTFGQTGRHNIGICKVYHQCLRTKGKLAETRGIRGGSRTQCTITVYRGCVSGPQGGKQQISIGARPRHSLVVENAMMIGRRGEEWRRGEVMGRNKAGVERSVGLIPYTYPKSLQRPLMSQ